ncbi:hypothetical protein GCM10011608_45190 [Micromonospora sonchi]|uniref:Uncharacterized protein n=1 Tax=Micromonospora sonchi TaxID=1763543 RepID=A0A917U405_9ACTN|nr:hypothetical protein GCM10011608_45190 [Micromonospora sonchi]
MIIVCDHRAWCGTDLTGPLRASGWRGPAANAALHRLNELDDEFEVASLQTRTAATVLREAAEEFEDLQRRLESAVSAAHSLGLTVDDSGRVSAPPMPAAHRNDPDADVIQRRDVQNVAIYTDLIAKIVAEATETDRQITRGLSGLKASIPGQRPYEYNKAQEGAQAAASALGLSDDDIPAPGSAPVDVNAWWPGLTNDERQIYLTAYPDRLGALDGLPTIDRDAANQLALRAFIGDNVNHYRDQNNPQHATALMLLDKLEEAENAPPHKRLYLLSLDPRGDGKAAVAIGNPDTAPTPPCSCPASAPNSTASAAYSAAPTIYRTPRSKSHPPRASPSWRGWARTPRQWAPTSSPLPSAASPKPAPAPSTASSTDSASHTTAHPLTSPRSGTATARPSWARPPAPATASPWTT